MDWTNDVVLRFLELYRMHPCIWDPKIEAHKNRTKVYDAWCNIKKELEFPGTIKELKKKRESLMSAYRGYKVKIKRSETSAVDVGDIYKPIWFAFELMDSFLASVYTCKLSVPSEPTEEAEIACDTLCHDPLRSEKEVLPNRVKQTTIEVSRNLTPPEPVKRKRKHYQTDNDDSSGTKTVEKTFQDDDLTAFGNYIVSTLRKFNARNCVEAQGEIFEVLSRYKLRQLESSEATFSEVLLPQTEVTAKIESPSSGDENDGW